MLILSFPSPHWDNIDSSFSMFDKCLWWKNILLAPWKLHTVYLDNNYPSSPTLPSSTAASLPTQLCFFFLVCKPIKSNLCYPYALRWMDFLWSRIDLPVAISLKKIWHSLSKCLCIYLPPLFSKVNNHTSTMKTSLNYDSGHAILTIRSVFDGMWKKQYAWNFAPRIMSDEEGNVTLVSQD